MDEEDYKPGPWERRINRFATWWIVIVIVSFPILKIATYVAYHPPDEPHTLKVRQVLAVWNWLMGLVL